MGKVLALDYGEKRVGVAISDKNREIAFVRPYIKNTASLFEEIKEFCLNEGILEVVVGVPYMSDLSETEQTKACKAFVEELRRELDVPVREFDESFSTFSAHQTLNEAQLKGENRSDLKDSFSALVILKNYLGL